MTQVSNQFDTSKMNDLMNNCEFDDIKQNIFKMVNQNCESDLSNLKNCQQFMNQNMDSLVNLGQQLFANPDFNQFAQQMLSGNNNLFNQCTEQCEKKKNPMKPSVTRVVNFKEFSPNANKRRIVTVKYEYNRIDKTLKYGAVIYTSTFINSNKYDKVGHAKTATDRFLNSPIVVNNFTSDKNIALFHKSIREQIHKYGVKSPNGSVVVYTMTTEPKLNVVKPKPVVNRETKTKQKKSTDDQMKKEMKQVITRFTNFREVRGNTKRQITMKYEYDRVNKTLKYGATIHKTNVDKPELYDKPGHKETAEKRFLNKPIVVTNFEDDSDQKSFNQKLRKQLYKNGVKSKK